MRHKTISQWLVTLLTVTVLVASLALLIPTVAQGDGGGLIVIITPAHDNLYYQAEADAAQAAAEALGYETLVLIHHGDPMLEAQQVEQAITRGAQAIILDPAGADASVQAVQRARDAGIPMFLIGHEIDMTGVAFSQIIANNYQGAILAGEEFVRLMGEEGQYVELLEGHFDTGSYGPRVQGWHDVFGDYPNMELVAIQTVSWSALGSYEVMETLIRDYPDIKGVLAESDTIAMGAMAALQAAGMTDVIVVGFGGSQEVLDAIQEGTISATVLQPVAQFGPLAIQQAHHYLMTGELPADEKIALDCILITPDNADDYFNYAPVEPDTEQVEGEGLIVIITPAYDDLYYQAEADAAEAAAEALGYETLVLIHDGDPALESQHVDLAIAQGAQAIILDPAGGDASVQTVQSAGDAGIPTFLIGHEIYESGIAASQIIANNYQGAILAGEEFVRLMGEEGQYVELLISDNDIGPLVTQAGTHIRIQGYNDVIEDYPDMELVAQQTANGSQTEAFAVMEAIIRDYPDIKGVICEDDAMAMGAMTALQAAGMTDVIVVGFGGSQEVLDAIQAGTIAATVMPPVAQFGLLAVQQAHHYLMTGELPADEKIALDCILITPDNADDYFNYAPVEPDTEQGYRD